jgi:hypothetical protein
LRSSAKSAHSPDISHREDVDVTHFCPFFDQ